MPFVLANVVELFFAGQERELLTGSFWHTTCNFSALSSEDFEVYERQIFKPGALHAVIQYYSTVWEDGK